MYENFIKESDRFSEDNSKDVDTLDLHYNYSNVSLLFEECGNSTFRNGVYRIHNVKSSNDWGITIGNYFPPYLGKIAPFGYDWLGRQFCTLKGNENLILLFDPSTCEDFKLEQNLIDFHNNDLIFDRESTLSEKLFKEILELLKTTRISYNDCIGYKTPPFLGGRDLIENYELINLEVYWEFQCQLYNQIKDLPHGTKINSIKFEKPK